MMGRDGGWRGDSRAALLAAAARLYGALLLAYPREFRRRYADEMRRAFRDLSREGLEEGGKAGLARVWAGTLSDLVVTALAERGTMLARNAYRPARPVAVARWGGLSALLGGALGMSFYLIGLPTMPISISFVLLLLSVLLCTLGLFGLCGTRSAPSGRPGRLAAAGAVFAVTSAGSWLAMGAFGALGLAWGWAVGPTHVAAAAGLCCWFVGLLLLGVAALGSRMPGRLRALPLAVAALVPVSLVLPAFTSVGMPLIIISPFLGSALLGWALLRDHGTVIGSGRLAVAGGAARRTTGTARWMAVTRTAGRAGATHTDASAAEVAKEKELLEVLGRRGELTVAGAALETSLSVEEADRMLSGLAAKGHLEVRVRSGRLLYALWQPDAPE